MNKNKQVDNDCSVSIFLGNSKLATTFVVVKSDPAPGTTPVLAPMGGSDNDELVLAGHHIGLLQKNVTTTVAAGKALYGRIAKLATLSAKVSKAAGDLSCVTLVTLDPTNSIQAISNTWTTVLV